MNELVACFCGRVHIRSDFMWGGVQMVLCDEVRENEMWSLDPRYLRLAAFRVPHPSVMW